MKSADFVLAHRYVDDELTREERGVFEERLKVEPRLSDYVDDVGSLVNASRAERDYAMPQVKFPPSRLFSIRYHLRKNRIAAMAPLAAGLSIILFMGLSVFHKPPPFSPEQTAVFRVVYYSAEASSVAIAGDFNNWTHEIPMSKSSDSGYWVGEISATAGEYRYVIVVDERDWVPDPTADYVVSDDFGFKNSVVRIGL